jgi:hypothetical protein
MKWKNLKLGFDIMPTDILHRLRSAYQQGLFLDFVQQASESGLLFEAIPELRGLNRIRQNVDRHPEGDVWTHTLLVIQNLPVNATFAMSLAALLHDIGKAKATVLLDTGAITAKGHEIISGRLTLEILDRIGADEQLKNEVAFLVRHHMAAHSPDTDGDKLRHLICEGSRELVDQLLQHGIADVAGGCRDFTECERLQNLFEHLDDELVPSNLFET